MNVNDKRKLLDAVDTLIKRPNMADEVTLGEAIGYFILLVEEATNGKMSMVLVSKETDDE